MSLARFQLGERGGGSIARRIDGLQVPGVDAHYRRALKLFVAEEHRHGEILARVIAELGGELLPDSWTDALFTFARRLLGLRLKLLVLLSAEVIGIAFYGRIAKALPPGAARQALEAICRDEEAHLRFHRDFFRSQLRGPGALTLLRAGLWTVGVAAVATVLVDHWRQLAAIGASPWSVGREMVGLLAKTDAGLALKERSVLRA